MKGPMTLDAEVTSAGSWWTCLPVGQATQVAEAHVPRMSASKFGRLDLHLTAGNWGETAGERMHRLAKTKRMRDGFTWAAGQ